ncbi:uncharacterized protein [Procambarus clarkii]|uniref:uncharacterized protein isoform X1 n=1 Tax=Procambarus clarkii TaxID=6728 RepID=UPI003742A04D
MLKTLRLYPKSTIRDLAEISLICNIDGLPIFRSKNESLWPVLCAINNVKPIRVFPVVLTYGSSKPSDLDFLNEFIQDLKKIMHYGFKNDDKTLPVKLKGVICDAPAKAMVKAIKLHSGYFGCDRCTQEGVWNGRMTYQQVKNLQLRTDEDFRNQSNSQHHHGRSPFCDLNINMVSTFPIDYMHQICLGVMKRLLLAWIRNKNVKLCARQVDEISQRLIQLTQFVPMHFARKPRSLSEVDRWKATEYRQLLLYTGKIVLKGILPKELYDHFLTLSVAISILVSPKLIQLNYSQYAHDLLLYFVLKARELYGKDFLVYNVHCLTHISSDAKEFGSLDRCSAFPFENYLQQVKNMVRSSKNPLVQIAKRLKEMQHAQRIYTPNTEHKIYTKAPNNAYLLNNETCCQVLDTVSDTDENGDSMFLCRVYSRSIPLFEKPCNSKLIGAFKVLTRNSSMKVIPARKLNRTGMMIETESANTFLSILHDL